MTITITLQTDSAAFGQDDPDARTAEVSRILTAYARDLIDTGAVLLPDRYREPLFDVNGNTIGSVRISEPDTSITYAGSERHPAGCRCADCHEVSQ